MGGPGDRVISRRTVFRGILLALLAAPLAAGAQPGATVYRIGFLGNIPPTKDPASQRFFSTFVQGLREAGWVEGRNTTIEWRYADGRIERFPDLAADLVRLKVDVIVSSALPAAQAAKQATTTIPIVAIGMSDPVGQGLIASLARPGGNITGFATLFPELAAKRLTLLKETLPKTSRVTVLRNPANPGNIQWGPLPPTGKRMQFEEIVILQIRDGKVCRQRGIADNLNALRATRRDADATLVTGYPLALCPPDNRLERAGLTPAAQPDRSAADHQESTWAF